MYEVYYEAEEEQLTQIPQGETALTCGNDDDPELEKILTVICDDCGEVAEYYYDGRHYCEHCLLQKWNECINSDLNSDYDLQIIHIEDLNEEELYDFELFKEECEDALWEDIEREMSD